MRSTFGSKIKPLAPKPKPFKDKIGIFSQKVISQMCSKFVPGCCPWRLPTTAAALWSPLSVAHEACRAARAFRPPPGKSLFEEKKNDPEKILLVFEWLGFGAKGLIFEPKVDLNTGHHVKSQASALNQCNSSCRAPIFKILEEMKS